MNVGIYTTDKAFQRDDRLDNEVGTGVCEHNDDCRDDSEPYIGKGKVLDLVSHYVVS